MTAPEILAAILRFAGLVFSGITEANRLNPRVFEIVAAERWSGWVVLAIAILGGASLLIGQSVILFVNKVRPGRFALSLVINGVMFAFSLTGWAAAIWLLSRLLGMSLPFHPVMRMTGVGAAPYVWGFLVLIPWAGPFIGRVLSVWSLLIVITGMRYLYGTPFLKTLLICGAGWLLIVLVNYTVGRPIVALRDRIYRAAAGSDLNTKVTDLLTTFSLDGQKPGSTSRR
jgi:hypothetical protein